MFKHPHLPRNIYCLVFLGLPIIPKNVSDLFIQAYTMILVILNYCYIKSAGPSLEGHQGCGSRVRSLFHSLLFSYASVFLIVNRAQKPADLPHQILNVVLGFRQKSFRFQACFQGLKSQKNGSQGTQKTLKIEFCNSPMRKQRFGSPTSKNRVRNR